jgi:hypothetical protein
MTQAVAVEVPRGRAKIAVAITIFPGILLLPNYGVRADPIPPTCSSPVTLPPEVAPIPEKLLRTT